MKARKLNKREEYSYYWESGYSLKRIKGNKVDFFDCGEWLPSNYSANEVKIRIKKVSQSQIAEIMENS